LSISIQLIILLAICPKKIPKNIPKIIIYSTNQTEEQILGEKLVDKLERP
jgi:hypothetical protein